MRLYIRCLCVLSGILFVFSGINTVSAAEIHGRSSTQLLWYNDIVDGSKQTDLAQYLRVSATGINAENKLSVHGYGRLVWDTKDGDVEDRVYYFYADYKNFFEKADVRVGRQFVNLSAGSTLLDGVEAEIKNIGPFGFMAMGGRNVIFGEEGQLTSHSYSMGFSAYLAHKSMTYFDVSYFRSYDYSDVARDIIGTSYKQYALESIKLYANARYDLTAEVFNEVLGGIKYFPTLNLMITGEHYESYPTFDTTSIYSVFAVDKFNENIIRAEYTTAAWLDISVGYSKEHFGEGAHAKVYEVGARLRPSINAAIGLFHDKRSGYPGNLEGYRVFADYSSIGKWKASAGIDYDVYQRDNMTGQETAKRYWAAGRYIFAKNMSSSVRVEDNVNINYSKDMQGRLTFDVDF